MWHHLRTAMPSTIQYHGPVKTVLVLNVETLQAAHLWPGDCASDVAQHRGHGPVEALAAVLRVAHHGAQCCHSLWIESDCQIREL